MRIKHLKVDGACGIKKLDIEFCDTDRVICVVDENENPFDEHAFLRVMERVYLDIFYPADYLCGNGEIQCFCQRFAQKFLISLKGKKHLEEICYRGEKWTGQVNGVEEVCYCGEEVSGRLKWIMRTDYREILYPTEMREYCKYDEKIADSAMQELVDAIDGEYSACGWLTGEEWKILQRRTERYLAEFQGVPFIDGQPLTFTRKGVLRFCERFPIFEQKDRFTQDEYARIQFLHWLAVLNLIKQLCRDIGRDGDLPIFVPQFFEKFDGRKDNGVLFEEMRKTGRQVFILLNGRNEGVERYCDKVINIGNEKNTLQ